MNQKQQTIILISFIIIAFFFLFLTYAQNVSLRNDNVALANAFFTNQNNLVEICKIDYNALVAEQQKQYYLDLNARLTGVNYKVG